MALICGTGEKKCSCLPWLSGFFFFPVVGHLIRLIGRLDVTINGTAVPMMCSVGVIVVGLILSGLFCWLGCRCKKEETGNKPASS